MVMNMDKSTSIKEFKAMLDTIYVVGGKWKMHIIYAICTHKYQRFMEI
jgi:DNA-binding HxlR family transcriptional regulator